MLLVDSVHRGRKHTNSIALALLESLMKMDYQEALQRELSRYLPTVTLRQAIDTRQTVDTIALMCHDPACGLPWAHIINGNVRIESDHGSPHTNWLYPAGLTMIHPAHRGLFFLDQNIPTGIKVDSDETSSKHI